MRPAKSAPGALLTEQITARGSCLRARTARHRFMPSREIFQRWIRRDAGRLRGEVDPNERSDIRDSEAIARDERLVADLRVEPLQLLLDGLALRFTVFGELL